MHQFFTLHLAVCISAATVTVGAGQEPKATLPTARSWNYQPRLLSPFWQGDVIESETVLFIRDGATGPATANVLLPIREVIEVRNSAGTLVYEPGRDFSWTSGSRELVLPAGSRITSRQPQDLRRPAKSQKHALTHRDGNGEILFGAELEYAEMQTRITYRHAGNQWKPPVTFDPRALPQTVARLVNRQPLTIVTLGDSITAGANASALYSAVPFQPPYPELVRRQLTERFRNSIELKNLAVGGTDTAWGLTQIPKVIESRPHLVILAFGMNDSGSRLPESFRDNTQAMMAKIREALPNCEFILVAPMLANRDWIRLRHEYFPRYRDALKELVQPGVALADLTAVWTDFLELKKDWDISGNGVNHPNDFGHRVYAQVITSLVDPRGHPDTTPHPETVIQCGPIKFIERRLLGNYTYSYACAAADLDGDGDLDLTSADAEPNSNLYLLRNHTAGRFETSFIQRYSEHADQPIRLERHAIGDVNRDGRSDVVIVDNLRSDIRWFENPGPENLSNPWPLHRVAQANEVPGSYDVALADLDADGDLDVASSSWKGERIDWFENVGRPGNGQVWQRHEVANKIGETRTIAIADLNRDGQLDLLATARTTNQVMWFEREGEMPLNSWKMHSIDQSTHAPAHGHPVDLDNDGDLDVVVACGIAAPDSATIENSHQVAWYENVGAPGRANTWKKHLISTGFLQGFEAVAGDLDSDGDLDVVATGWSPHGQIAWFENSGDPRRPWKQHSIKQRWSNAVTVIVADLDRDGRLDIVACAERGANELRWWRNAGID